MPGAVTRILLAAVLLFVALPLHAQKVYFNDFQGTVGPEWSSNLTDTTPTGHRRFLGQFGKQTTTLTLANLPTHTSLTLTFDLFLIRTWDGNNADFGINGPDVFQVSLIGGAMLLNTTFSNVYYFGGFNQSYPKLAGQGDYAPFTGASEMNTLGYLEPGGRPDDSVYHLTFTFSHASSDLQINFTSLQSEGIANESWGLDNVRVNLGPVPVPADFNGDGNTDLIWQNAATGDVSVWYMKGATWTGNWDYLGRNIPTAWKIVGVTDLNGDGKPDLIWQNNQTGDVTYWRMDGIRQVDTGFIARNVPTVWKIVGVADLNRDGKADLIWRNSQTGDVTVWYLNGTTWTGNWDYIAAGIPLAWKMVGTADLNNDGKPDLIWQNGTTGDVSVWYMNGAQWTGNWASIAQGVPTDWKLAAFLDANGDGDPDFIWQNTSTGDATIWYMSGAVWSGAWDYIYYGVPTNWGIAPTG